MRWSWTKKEPPPPAGVPVAVPAFEPIFPPRPAAAPLSAEAPPAATAPDPPADTAIDVAPDGDAPLGGAPGSGDTVGPGPAGATPIGARLVELEPEGLEPGAMPAEPLPLGLPGLMPVGQGWAGTMPDPEPSQGAPAVPPAAKPAYAELLDAATDAGTPPDVAPYGAVPREAPADGPPGTGSYGSGLPGAAAPAAGLPAHDASEPGAGAEAGVLLEALYPLLLRRALDEHGRRHYGAVLRERGIPRGVVPVLRSLLESEEHRGVAAQNAVDALLRRDVTPGFGPVQHVISLGTSCYAAWLMQQCGVKRWSGPFDWLFGGLDMVVHCLEDDFESFLDTAQLQALGDGRSTHRRYGPGIAAGPVFNHRDVTLSEHRSYTERCVARFRTALASPQTKCFVMVAAGHPSRPDSRLVGDFARLLEALSARTQGFRLLMVSHDQAEGGLASGLREVESRAEGSLFRFRSASAMQAGLSFRQEWDNLTLKRLLWSNHYDLRDAPGG